MLLIIYGQNKKIYISLLHKNNLHFLSLHDKLWKTSAFIFLNKILIRYKRVGNSLVVMARKVTR